MAGEESLGCCPMFDGNGHSFTIWKSRTLLFLNALDYHMPEILANGPHVQVYQLSGSPEDSKSGVRNKPLDQWTDEDRRLANLDARARYHISKALPDNVFRYVQHSSTAKEMLETLGVAYEGAKEAKEARKYQLIQEYNFFGFYSGETLTQAFVRFSSLVNDLRGANEEKDDCHLVRKFMDALPGEWNLMVTILTTNGEIKRLTMASLYDKLLWYELESRRLQRLEDAHQQNHKLPS